MANLTTTTQKINSPGLERFDELISKLRKSALTTRENPFPSIHAPKPSKKSQPTTKQEKQVVADLQPQTEPVNSHSKDGKTGKPPPSTGPAKAGSFLVDESASADPGGAARPSDPTPDAPAGAELTKLDWASLVEAARQSDAEEDQLPDLTEWATNKAAKNSRLLPTADPSPLKRDIPPHVLSPPQFLPSHSSSLAQILPAPSPKPSPPPPPPTAAAAKTPRDNQASGSPTRVSDDRWKAGACSDRTPSRTQPQPSCSRVLNEKQKQSIARLIIPVGSESGGLASVFSASTTAGSTAARSSISSASCPAVKPALSQDNNSGAPPVPRHALAPSSPSSTSSGPLAPVDAGAGVRAGRKTRGPRLGGRPLDPAGLRVVSGCLSAASDRRALPAAANAARHRPDPVPDAAATFPVRETASACAASTTAPTAKKSKKKKRALPPPTGEDKPTRKSGPPPPSSSSIEAEAVVPHPHHPSAPHPVSALTRAGPRSRPSVVLFDKLTGGALLLK